MSLPHPQQPQPGYAQLRIPQPGHSQPHPQQARLQQPQHSPGYVANPTIAQPMRQVTAPTLLEFWRSDSRVVPGRRPPKWAGRTAFWVGMLALPRG